MPEASDPYRHHPRLRDLITPPAKSFMRGKTLAQIAALIEDNGGDPSFLFTEEEREACRARTLEHWRGRELWVFAYGSLIWDPGIYFTEMRRAFVPTVQRRFILKDIGGGRGSADNPGVMAALDHGDGCDGMVFRIAAENVDAETYWLWMRERTGAAYHPAFVAAETAHGTVQALTFLADHDSIFIDASMTHEQQVQFCASGKGFFGTSLEYVENIAKHFDELGIVDAGVTRLLHDARAYRAAME